MCTVPFQQINNFLSLMVVGASREARTLADVALLLSALALSNDVSWKNKNKQETK